MNIYVSSTAAGAVAVACAAFMIWSFMKNKVAPPYSGPHYINEDINIKTCNPACVPGVVMQRPHSSGTGGCALDGDADPGTGDGDGADAHADAGADATPAELPDIQYEPVDTPPGSGSASTPAPVPGSGTTSPPAGAVPTSITQGVVGKKPSEAASKAAGNTAIPQKGGSRTKIPEIKQTMIERKIKLLKATLKHSRVKR